MKKEEFKSFVQKNPKLISYVKNNEMTWQKFYEMYDLYGEDENIWKDYITTPQVEEKTTKTEKVAKAGIAGLTLSEVVNWFKNVDLDGIQESIGSVQRVLGVVQDLSKKDNTTSTNQKQTYKPRPLYKHFED
ncbi:MAG: hypothetical protein IJY25_01315 [Bacilli bacterium]|nr:hypothetical protein [Bacilli bacterium]